METLTTRSLAQMCKAEIQAFAEQVNKHVGVCYELFKRGFFESDDEALTAVLQNFRFRIERWIVREAGFEQTYRSVDYFVATAFRQFYIALLKHQASDFPNLAAFLGYLRLCVTSAVRQELRHRKKEKALVSIEDEILHPDVSIDDSSWDSDATDAQDIWQHIAKLFPDEKTLLLIRLRYVEKMMPADISQAYPDDWKTARDVTIALYPVRKKLREDPYLRRLAGVTDKENS